MSVNPYVFYELQICPIFLICRYGARLYTTSCDTEPYHKWSVSIIRYAHRVRGPDLITYWYLFFVGIWHLMQIYFGLPESVHAGMVSLKQYPHYWFFVRRIPCKAPVMCSVHVYFVVRFNMIWTDNRVVDDLRRHKFIQYRCNWLNNYTPSQRSWRGGILDSPCPSVYPSVRLSVRLSVDDMVSGA